MNSSPEKNWRPSCSWETLKLRADLLDATRQYFRNAGYLEVETPLLSRETVVDRHLDPIVALLHQHRGSQGQNWFLQTSPEFGMKRLLADLHATPGGTHPAGLVQITKAFRDGEVGRLHNPEFTMIEWYGLHQNYHDQMDLTESLVRHLSREIQHLTTDLPLETPALSVSDAAFSRISYDAACERTIGCRLLHQSAQELMILCRAEGIEPPISLDVEDRDELLNLLLVEKVEAGLGIDQPEFLIDYPATQAALARVRDQTPPVAERFELYWRGIELCNGYSELTDPEILRARIISENARRQQAAAGALPAGEHLLEAMASGLPECSGVALGFDRLLMLLLGKTSLTEVLAFSHERA